MRTIGELCDVYRGTDKKLLGYPFVYDMAFSPIRMSVKKVLEIGIDRGDSLRIWRDFFPNAEIYGWDCDHDACFQDTRIKTMVVNHDDRQQVADALSSIGYDIDVIIEDGGHNMDSQQRLLAWCFPFVANGGFYMLEDLHTSFVAHLYKVRVGMSNTTYGMLTDFQANRLMRSEYLTEKETEYLQSRIGAIGLFSFPQQNGHPCESSVVSIIKKTGVRSDGNGKGDPVVGTWKNIEEGNIYIFTEDFKCETPWSVGDWETNSGNYRCRWPNGSTNEFSVSSDGNHIVVNGINVFVRIR